MTLEEESRLSFYKELTVIDDKKNVILVQHIDTKELYVKKRLDIYSKDVYEQLAHTYVYGIPVIKECIEDEGSLVVVEEYIQGKNLKQLMDEHGLFTEQQAYQIALELAQILTGLQSLSPPVIHRDIKPSNIIIEKNGHIHLIDFNAARHVSDKKNEDTRMLGTVYFAAPEQYGFGQSDQRTDIYGFGATINYLMTGDKPGAGIARCGFTDILTRCLKVDVNDRYSSAGELLQMLRTKINTGVRQPCNDMLHVVKVLLDRQYNNHKEQSERINSSWRKYLLPGFRSLNLVYCILAILWYAFVIWMTSGFTVSDGHTGVMITGLELLLYKITVLLMFMGL
ncbi:MAG: serine/threonine-protein kinase, partial [Lachnospira sp.]|nr:serine/threonine-protein kinase [Lachnospira sp.]